MPNVYTHYVTWISRRKRRRTSAFVDIVPPPLPSVMTTGDKFQATWAPPSISWVDSNDHPQSANFAFWSVKGGTEGALVSTANVPPIVSVGNADIVATAWYISGGPDGQGAGVWIDAFDVDLGDFVDDDFVTVVPDASGILTAGGNNDGFVPTASQEHINASLQIHSIPLSHWEVISESVPGTVTVNNEDLLATAQSAALAFAFYQSGPPVVVRGHSRRLLTIPGEDSLGKQAMKWLGAARITQYINEWHLLPMSAEDKRIYLTQTPTQLRCAVGVPHLHYNKKTYLLKPEQWKIITNNVQNELSRKLTNAKSVSFDDLVEISKAMEKVSARGHS